MVPFRSWNFFFLLPAFPTLWESTFGQQDTLSQSQAALHSSGPIRRAFTKSRRCTVKRWRFLTVPTESNESRAHTQTDALSGQSRGNRDTHYAGSSAFRLLTIVHPRSFHINNRPERGVTCPGSKWGRAGLACGWQWMRNVSSHIPHCI